MTRAERIRHGELASALALQLVGAVAALVVALQTWQVVRTPRPSRRPDDVLRLTGRLVDAAPTALALVALAGVVAVVATRGQVRRVVGAVVAISGAALGWRALSSSGAVSASRARTFVADRHRTVPLGNEVMPSVTVHTVWPVLSVVCGLLVLAGGVLIAWRGHRWSAMSSRYEAQPAAEENEVKAATAMWTALDRGEDPTTRTSERA